MGIRRLEKLMEEDANRGVIRHQKKKKDIEQNGLAIERRIACLSFSMKVVNCKSGSNILCAISLNLVSLISYDMIIVYLFIWLSLYLNSP